MENLKEESLINKNEKNKEIIEKEIQSDEEEEKKGKENIENNINEEENEKEGVFSTDFAGTIELTEEERNMRKNYLKKITKKEALVRSITLGKKTYFSKIYNFLLGLLYDYLNIKETKYKSDSINAITAKDLDAFMISIKYYITTIIISKIVNILDDKLLNYISNDNTKNIMLENFLYKKDMVFFDLFKTGELMNKVQNYSDYPYFSLLDTITRIFEYIFKIFYFGYYLYKDYFEMSVIYIIIVVIQTILEPYVYAPIENNEEMVEKYELKENYINDMLSNIRLIKSFGTEAKELKRVSNIEQVIKEKSFFGKILEEFYNHLFNLNEILIFYICGKKTITGKMDYGELLVFQGYSGEFRASFNNVKEMFKSIKEGINSWVKFLQLYDIEQTIVSRKNIIPNMEENLNNNDNKNSNNINNKNNNNNNNNKGNKTKGFDIIFNNVTFSYPTKKKVSVIKNLNLNVEAGKTVAIVGSSGSGKTTLTNLLLRFYDVDEGEILINGIDIKDINLAWLRNNIGIVSQEPVLTSGTIRENILYGVDNYTEKKFIDVCKLANVYSFATDKKIFPKEFETIVGERGIKISGGQKQRIAIARALMKDAKILIFDEATSALDSENEAMVQQAINNVINKKKITTIIIAHRLSTVKNANVIYVMNYGKIVEFGSHDELIEKNGEYKKLIQRQLVK